MFYNWLIVLFGIRVFGFFTMMLFLSISLSLFLSLREFETETESETERGKQREGESHMQVNHFEATKYLQSGQRQEWLFYWYEEAVV